MCARGEGTASPVESLDDATLAELAASPPPMSGGEYIDAALLAEQWRALDAAFVAALQVHRGSVAELLQTRHAARHLAHQPSRSQRALLERKRAALAR